MHIFIIAAVFCIDGGPSSKYQCHAMNGCSRLVRVFVSFPLECVSRKLYQFPIAILPCSNTVLKYLYAYASERERTLVACVHNRLKQQLFRLFASNFELLLSINPSHHRIWPKLLFLFCFFIAWHTHVIRSTVPLAINIQNSNGKSF